MTIIEVITTITIMVSTITDEIITIWIHNNIAI